MKRKRSHFRPFQTRMQQGNVASQQSLEVYTRYCRDVRAITAADGEQVGESSALSLAEKEGVWWLEIGRHLFHRTFDRSLPSNLGEWQIDFATRPLRVHGVSAVQNKGQVPRNRTITFQEVDACAINLVAAAHL
jgi:hypothetical protein